MLIQQGDVLFESCDEIPYKVKRVEPQNGRYVLVEGEATGHAHAVEVFDEKLGIFEDKDGTLYMEVPETTEVVHEEHNTVEIPPGTYRVHQVRIKERRHKLTFDYIIDNKDARKSERPVGD